MAANEASRKPVCAFSMCSEPVTLGGGITMQKGALGVAASAWK